MIIPILISFLSTAFYSVSCIVDSLLTNTHFKNASTIVFFTSITNMMFTPLLFFFGTPAIPTPDVLFVIIILSAIDVLYLIPWYMALKKIDTSISTSLFALGRVITPVFAWLVIGEKLEPIAYVGFFIIIATNFFLNFDMKSLKINSAFYLMLIVASMLSITGTLQKYSLHDFDFITILFWCSVVSTILTASFLLLPKIRKDIRATIPTYKKNFRLFFATEFFNAGGGATGIIALSGMPVLLKSSLGTIQPLFVLLLGWILYKIFGDIYKESFDRSNIIKKIISFVITAFGIVLVTLGSE